MHKLARYAVAAATCTFIGTSLAHAQATRTWVSGVGDDANPCSRTAPCKTFAGAISKTAAKGEISALDPGGFGAVTITKSITINGDGTLASILASLTNGVIVSAGANDVVVLRNLSINGGGNGFSGVQYNSGGSLVIQDSSFVGFTENTIDVTVSNNASLSITNTKIVGGSVGLRVYSPTSSRVDVSLKNVSISGTGTGIDSQAIYGHTTVSDSVLTQNYWHAVLAEAGVVALDNNMLTSNGDAAQANPGAVVILNNNGVYENVIGFGCGGGTLASANNNHKTGPGGGCAPVPTVGVQ
jgi:hypothetical protein